MHPGWRLGLGAVAIGATLVVIAPLGAVLDAVRADPASALGALSRPQVWRLTADTIALGIAVTMSSLVLATALALAITRTRLPGGRAWLVPLSLPLAIPSFLIAEAHRRSLGVEGPIAAWLSLTLITYPLALLPLEATIRRASRDLEHAARCFGCSPFRAFRRATLPQITPTLEWTALLVLLYALSDYGAPAMLGLQVLTTAIESRRVAFDVPGATALSLILCALALVCIVGIGRCRSSRWWIMPGAPIEAHREPASSRAAAWAGAALCAATVALAFALPVAMIAAWWPRPNAGHEAGLASVLSPAFLETSLGALSPAWAATARSLAVALVAAALCCALAVPFVMLGHRGGEGERGRRTRRLSTLALVGYGLPGVVIGFAYVRIGLATPGLYQTLPLLLAGYTARCLAETLGPASAAARRMPPERLDAARGLGASFGGAWWRIGIPAVAPGLVAGAALAFLTVVKELPITMILRPTGFDTLAFELFDSLSEAMYARAAPMAAALVVVSTAVVAGLVATQRE